MNIIYHRIATFLPVVSYWFYIIEILRNNHTCFSFGSCDASIFYEVRIEDSWVVSCVMPRVMLILSLHIEWCGLWYHNTSA